MQQLPTELNYLTQLERYQEIKPGLAVMIRMLAALDNPHHQLPTIHIAGTNGKGSTAAFLASVLTAAGCKTGLYTSPHLHHFNERVQVNGQPVTNQELISLIAKIRQATQQHQLEPTYFEFTTALAFLYLAQQQVDIAVIEVGLGGSLDATNVITPLVSVITNIGLDHTEWLGQTKQAIAARKAGIIKPHVPVITAETDPNILAYLKNIATPKNSQLYAVHEHLDATVTNHSLTNQTFTPIQTPIQTPGVRINATSLLDQEFSIPLLGKHQITNALTALLTLRHLKAHPELSVSVKASAVKKGLAETHWPGRLDVVSQDPFILVDGAHNLESIAALSDFLSENLNLLPPLDVLVIGMKRDKNLQPIIDHLVPKFRQVIVTEGKYQPTPASQLAAQLGPVAQAIPDIKQALTQAQQDLKPNHLMLITGSLYMIGDALTILRK